jgi:ABC-type dipeptide/oligopeptide/nickel transport system permease subunit
MNLKQRIALAVLGVVVAASLGAGWVAQHSYAEQSREFISAPPSAQFWLGTDELGRDRFARLLYGTRVSLLLAPAAALLSTLLAALIGGAAGYLGGRWERLVTAGLDLFLSLPWLFLLLAVRALLPLNTSPLTSVTITFLLLGCLGWAAPARIIRAGTRTLVSSDYLLQASASGISRRRLFWRHLLPNLRPIFLAQFWISVPLFI